MNTKMITSDQIEQLKNRAATLMEDKQLPKANIVIAGDSVIIGLS